MLVGKETHLYRLPFKVQDVITQEQLSGITIPSSLRLELKSLKRSETCIFIDNGYIKQEKLEV